MFNKLFGKSGQTKVTDEKVESDAITEADGTVELEENTKLTPYYLKDAEYPKGFNPFFPSSSTKNALAVVEQIRDSLHAEIEEAARSTKMVDSLEYERDNRAAKATLEKIDVLIAQIKPLENQTKTSLLRDQDASFGALNGIVTSAKSTTEDMPIASKQQLNAMCALIDILQITRRAIPKVQQSSALMEAKGSIQATINDAVRHKTIIERIIARSEDPKQQLKTMKGAETTENPEATTDAEATTNTSLTAK